jgi:cytochrome c553
MNRAFLPCIKSLLLAAMAVSGFAFAGVQPVHGKNPDVAKGEALYSTGDNARGIPACSSCHGAAGNSTISTNPKLAGQHEAVLAKQLRDYAGPDRKHAIMSPYAKALKEDEIINLAAYLSGQVQKQGAAKNPDLATLGKKIFRGGIAEKRIPACAGCHAPNGAGIPAQFPRIAGQHQDYTKAQLLAFRSDERKNSLQMQSISKNLSEKEIDALADYIAGLR